jgi:hypothetical protein
MIKASTAPPLRRVYSVGARAIEPQRREERREESDGEGAPTDALSATGLQAAEGGLSLRPSRLCGLTGLTSTAWLRLSRYRCQPSECLHFVSRVQSWDFAAGSAPPEVGQAFQPAGSGDFPVARTVPRGWKTPLTGRLESLPYTTFRPYLAGPMQGTGTD